MRIPQRSLLLVPFVLLAAACARANMIASLTPYGPAIYGAWADGWGLIFPTILVEAIYLIKVVKPPKPKCLLFGVIAGVHLVSYPVSMLITSGDSLYYDEPWVFLIFIGLAEAWAVCIEYFLYRRIATGYFPNGEMGRCWQSRKCSLMHVFFANLLSFLIGVGLLFLFNPEGERRAPIFTARSDMRSLATAIESYRIDWGPYPRHLDVLTTPIAYVSDIPRDPLSPSGKGKNRQPIQYYHRGEDWILWSAGTDKVYDIRHEILESFFDLTNATTETLKILHAQYTYDPTNGVPSPGDAWRVRQ